MNRHLSFLGTLAIVLVGCVAFSQPPGRSDYYLTAVPKTITDSTVDSATVNLLERTVAQINVITAVARRDQHEEVACAPVRSDGHEFWITGFLEPAEAYKRTRNNIIQAVCPAGHAMVHWHWAPSEDGGAEAAAKVCEPSVPDRVPAAAAIPVQLLVCGFGLDSIVAYKVRRREWKRGT